ncbi:uncharacterized protein IL334_001817 [Kwoniella shivajii]|uniref:Uncharacterized protein n=1 Tax=Kwoniella shivajii TaxID=564305 RepID=A0ABZ1CW17_9TREE|nr:hypothetical protein IL334_001817 [Kwoniella shivajii]
MNSRSSLPSITELSTPRHAPSPTLGSGGACTPPLVRPGRSYEDERESEEERPRDSGVHAIGAFFSSPYDSHYDSDPEEKSSSIVIPSLNSDARSRTPITRGRTRVGSVIVNKTCDQKQNQNQNQSQHQNYKNVLESKIKSQAGEVDIYESFDELDGLSDEVHYLHHGKDQQLKLPKSPAKSNEVTSRQSDESGRVRPLTVVEFPEPSLKPQQGYGKGYPSPNHSRTKPDGPIPSLSDGPTAIPPIPKIVTTDPNQLRPELPSKGYSIGYIHNSKSQPTIDTASFSFSPPRTINLPPPSSPISPLLAAPPLPHFSPLSPPSSPFASARGVRQDRPDSTNGSIRGFDIMAEKKALFREGQEELMSPFATRRTERARQGRAQTKSAFLASGMDFWKRFNAHAELDEGEKAVNGDSNGSAWLSKAKARDGRIKKMIWIFLFLLVILIGALLVYFLTRPSPNPKSIATGI